MSTSPRRLAAVGLASLGLALSLAPVQASAAPAPSKNEPSTRQLAGALADQQLTWHACDFSGHPKSTQDRLNAVPGVACATVTVPRDWHNPADGNTITLEVSKTATSTGNPDRQGIALVNPGGPGGEGVVWGPAMALSSPTLAAAYDFVGFDPRGVGKSTTPLVCEYVDDFDFTPAEAAKSYADGCLNNPLTPYITTEQTVYDMDFIRELLGEKKTSVVGYSYGTWLGAWYGGTFSSKTHRLLLDSATQLQANSLQETWDLQPHSRDRQFQQHLMAYMARNPELFYMGEDPDAIRAAWEKAGGTRDRFGAALAAFFIIPAMYDNSEYVSAGMGVRVFAYTTFVEGQSDEEKLQIVVDKLLAEPQLTAANKAFVRSAQAKAAEHLRQDATGGVVRKDDGAFEAIRCQDGAWNSSVGYWTGWLDRLQAKAPFIAPFMSIPTCAFWPAQAQMPQAHAKTTPPTLIVQSELDAATPYEGAAKAAQTRPNTWMISVDNEGSHGIYPYLTSCVDDQVEAFMLTGATPAKKFGVCQAKPLPEETETFAVGADLGGNGRLKVKTVPKDVRDANEFVKDLLQEQALAER